MNKNLHITLMSSIFILTVIAVYSCAIQEKAMDISESPLRESPVMVVTIDSLQAIRLNSVIQSSAEAVLVNLTIRDGNVFKLAISEEQAKELGIPLMLYKDYISQLNEINH